jgi:hypothetical protein
MLLLIAVLAVVSAAFLLFRFSRQREIGSYHQLNSDVPPPNARPLFAPTDDELCREIAEKKARSIARREYRAKAEARAAVDKCLLAWRDSPDSIHTAELLRETAEHGIEGDFARAAGEIVKTFRSSGIQGVTSSGDLAALLDSHYRLLPAAERSSGELFWLKEEIARLSEHS